MGLQKRQFCQFLIGLPALDMIMAGYYRFKFLFTFSSIAIFHITTFCHFFTVYFFYITTYFLHFSCILFFSHCSFLQFLTLLLIFTISHIAAHVLQLFTLLLIFFTISHIAAHFYHFSHCCLFLLDFNKRGGQGEIEMECG